MDIISRTPTEILDQVFSYIPISHRRLGGLDNCCLVNKVFNTVATAVLYRHITLEIGLVGFKEHIVRTLLTKRYKSYQFIREISIKLGHGYPGIWAAEIYISPHIEDKAAVHIAAFIESLAQEQLHSINSDYVAVLKYLPRTYHAKIKGLQHVNTLQLPPKVFFTSLRSFCFKRSQDNAPLNLHNSLDWAVCTRYRHQLKSLGISFSWLPSDHNSGDGALSNLYLEALEYLSIHNIPEDEYSNASILDRISFKNVKKFEISQCYTSLNFLLPRVAEFVNLTNLAFWGVFEQGRYRAEDTDNMLLKIPSRLNHLYLTVFSTSDEGLHYPRKGALQRHSETLRKVWLEIDCVGEGAFADQARSSFYYRHENRYRVIEIPVHSEADDTLDLDTLSKFPYLEHLVVPLAAPKSWTSWAPSFPKLRSFYFVNSCKIYCSKDRPPTKCFRQDWINWFTSKSGQDARMSKMPELQLVAFQRINPISENFTHSDHIFEITKPGSRGFTAHFRDPGVPGHFNRSAVTSEAVRYWYPDAWSFFRGYFMAERPEYVWPTNDTNVAKGIFEDSDELEGIPSYHSGLVQQDYSLQLTLLTQQNRKRLLIARAEQDAELNCPIPRPKHVAVAIPPWGISENAESKLGEGCTCVSNLGTSSSASSTCRGCSSIPADEALNPMVSNQHTFQPVNFLFDSSHKATGLHYDMARYPSQQSQADSDPPQTLEDYQNQFLFFDEQVKKRREYITAEMKRVKTPPLQYC